MTDMSNTPQEAVILVGGLGTRLKSLVNDRPKPMAIVAGKPFLEWVLVGLKGKGIKRVILCTGFMHHFVSSYFADGRTLGLELAYSVDPYPLGTGGAVRNALGQIAESPSLVLNGDSFCDFDVNVLASTHMQTNAAATVWTSRVTDPGRFGTVVVTDDDCVIAFNEKLQAGGSGVVNAGVYLLNREVVTRIPKGKSVSLETEVFPSLVGNGLCACVGDAPFHDIGTPESLLKAEKFLSDALSHEAVRIDR